jgi:hypothetical protein
MKLDGSRLLALVVAGLWVVVYLVTQVLTQPALAPGWTIAVGVALTVVLILGYPSPLRGPRQLRRSEGGLRRPWRDGASGIAIMRLEEIQIYSRRNQVDLIFPSTEFRDHLGALMGIGRNQGIRHTDQLAFNMES